MKNRPTTVTQGPWCVAVATGSSFDGARLEVFRTVDIPGRGTVYMHPYGWEGKWFANQEQAWAWALSHGYSEIYYRRTWCPIHRRLHWFLGGASPVHGKTCDYDDSLEYAAHPYKPCECCGLQGNHHMRTCPHNPTCYLCRRFGYRHNPDCPRYEPPPVPWDESACMGSMD
jgi:hypothetical protein